MKILLILLAGFSLQAQNIKVSGVVKDSLQQPLSYANILAVPQNDMQDMRFAITNSKGYYVLKLAKNQTYNITTSYLGFYPDSTALKTIEKDIIRDVILIENPNQLDEVNLNYTPAVTVKKDTIVYLTDKFKTGEERKLKDVLKKLPGVEVDKKGNVSVNGKKVTKVLVEDKTFFTGNSKLAVNNIPADAVDKVEILDNYSDVAMLKGLEDSEDMAMNIKLKEDKKKFVFGDVEVGAGFKNRYTLHPSLFYYSPKTTLNVIGDFNNTGVKSFTLKDFIDFEGGYSKLLSGSGSFSNIYNSDISQYLDDNDYKESITKFGAFNARQSLTKSTDLSAYVISSYSKNTIENQTINDYVGVANPFIENRSNAITNRSAFTLGKATLEYKPSFEEDFAYTSIFKVSNNEAQQLFNTTSPIQNYTVNTTQDIVGLDLKQGVNYSRKLSNNHTATLETNYNFKQDQPKFNWETNQLILQNLIPLESDNLYSIFQNKTIKTHTANAVVKDYWVLNNFTHFYPFLGVNTTFSTFENQDFQQLTSGAINNFSANGFGNDNEYQFTDTFFGLDYKFQIGLFTFKPSLVYHFYNWRISQDSSRIVNAKGLLLPKFTTKVEFSNSHKVNFRYQLNTRFARIDYLNNNFILSNFNSVFKGNPNLENQIYHSARLSYYKFSLFSNLNINAAIGYNKKTRHIKSATELQGIDRFSTLVMLNRPEQNVNITAGVSKKINKIKYSLRSRYTYNDFIQLINNSQNIGISKNISNTFKINTSFKQYPNIELGYTNSYNTYKSGMISNEFVQDNAYAELEYDFLNDFIFKADYNYELYKNKNQNINNKFENANASLFYQKEDSPWGFEVAASNLFNTKFRQENSFSEFLVSDTKSAILPRMVLFKISYKL